MGRVWRARHTVLDATVAVKFLHRSVDELDATMLARFQREARATAKLDCRYVVRVLDAGATAEGVPYLVMEHLRGQTVAQRIQRQGPLPVAEVALIVLHTTRALEAAHGAGIHHRDVSAGNLFLGVELDGSPLLKVLDFGVAKLVSEDSAMTQTGVALGTPRYMSPEQTMGQAVDHRSDLWALAAVAYEALTGVPAFSGITAGAVALEIARGEVVPPSGRVPELPAALDAFMLRAFAKNIDERFGDARAFAVAFSDAVEGHFERGLNAVDWRVGEDPNDGLSPSAMSVGTGAHASPEQSVSRSHSSDLAQSTGAAVTRTPSSLIRTDAKRSLGRGRWFVGALAAVLGVVLLVVGLLRGPASPQKERKFTSVSIDEVTAPLSVPRGSSSPDGDSLVLPGASLPEPTSVPVPAPSFNVPTPTAVPKNMAGTSRGDGSATASYGAGAKGAADAAAASKAPVLKPLPAEGGAMANGLPVGSASAVPVAPQVTAVVSPSAAPPKVPPRKRTAGSIVIDGVTDYGF